MSTELPQALRSPLDVLIIDNFDSFTWNLYQSLCLLGAQVTVIRNDAIPASSLELLRINSLIISPGPGHPQTDSGISKDAIKFFSGKVPVLGVCMGLECLVDVHGGDIKFAGEIKHGKLSLIRHDGRGIFNNLAQSFKSTRYHSLSASLTTLPSCLAITAVTEESGVIMAVRHREYTVEAVQYHPESVLSECGDDLFRNFLQLKGGRWEDNPDSRVLDTDFPPFPIEALTPKPSGDISAQIPTILEKIYARRRADVATAKAAPGTTPYDLQTQLSLGLAPPLISFHARLRSTPKTALLAEIKRASPSLGALPLPASFSAPAQALKYAQGGASVISVLTEPVSFRGSLTDMSSVRAALSRLPNRPAVLRKDFILDEYQIIESRLHGADTVLLIVAMLPPTRLKALYLYSLSLGMEPLVEVNNASEMNLALDLGAKVIGVNNRNLHNFSVDMTTTTRLADLVLAHNAKLVNGKRTSADDVILIALSGIRNSSDVKTFQSQGVRGVLVGEALMRADDPGQFMHSLLQIHDNQPTPISDHVDSPNSLERPQIPPLVKICGIKTASDAVAVASAGADLLGLIFVPSSKRYIDMQVAKEISAAIRAMSDSVQENASVNKDVPSEENLLDSPWFTTHAKNISLRRSLSHSSSHRPLLVGVFQDAPLTTVISTVESVGLDMVQLHGNEPVEWARWISVPVIKVCHVKGQAGSENQSLKDARRAGFHQFVLLDSMREDGLSGGSGKVADLEFAKRVVKDGEAVVPVASRLTDAYITITTPAENGASMVSPSSFSTLRLFPRFPMPIILAGGLTPANVHHAVEQVRPWAVDVSGGVENESGVAKDIAKVEAFIEAVKGSQD